MTQPITTEPISRTDLHEAISAGEVTVVDALGEHFWAQRHLPGAIPLLAEDVAAKAAELLPDKAATIVVYCSNPACGNSQAVASKLANLGYTSVRKYAAGIEDWVDAGLPTGKGLAASVPD
jgi:rhodanese-related sulfurtransferase